MTQLTDFLAKFLAPAQASHAKFAPRGPFISISLAQTIIESDWGKVSAGTNNYWGIKANADQIAAGQFKPVWTHETLNGIYQKVIQRFATYPTLESGFDAHAHLLTTPWYQRCIDAQTPNDYAHALWLCHYATGIPGHPYDQALINIMASNNLYQFDATPKEVVSDPSGPTHGWYWAQATSYPGWEAVEFKNTGRAYWGTGEITISKLGPPITKPANLE